MARHSSTKDCRPVLVVIVRMMWPDLAPLKTAPSTSGNSLDNVAGPNSTNRTAPSTCVNSQDNVAGPSSTKDCRPVLVVIVWIMWPDIAPLKTVPSTSGNSLDNVAGPSSTNKTDPSTSGNSLDNVAGPSSTKDCRPVLVVIVWIMWLDLAQLIRLPPSTSGNSQDDEARHSSTNKTVAQY